MNHENNYNNCDNCDTINFDIINENEINFYNNLKFNNKFNNLLLFWNLNNPNLKYLTKLYYQILIINASSSNSERNFSTAGNIITKTRNNLKEKKDLFESLMHIKSNIK